MLLNMVFLSWLASGIPESDLEFVYPKLESFGSRGFKKYLVRSLPTIILEMQLAQGGTGKDYHSR